MALMLMQRDATGASAMRKRSLAMPDGEVGKIVIVWKATDPSDAFRRRPLGRGAAVSI